MHRLKACLTIFVASIALLLLAYSGTLFVSGHISFLYCTALGLDVTRGVA